jgi:hypothetical protein
MVNAAQHEVSPAVLRRKTPEEGLLLAEREVVLRRNLPEVYDAGSFHPCDGRPEAVSAAGELTKSAEN